MNALDLASSAPQQNANSPSLQSAPVASTASFMPTTQTPQNNPGHIQMHPTSAPPHAGMGVGAQVALGVDDKDDDDDGDMDGLDTSVIDKEGDSDGDGEGGDDQQL
jgi:hypothetical protein